MAHNIPLTLMLCYYWSKLAELDYDWLLLIMGADTNILMFI